jgi:uncharacterized heparinase superfamily protein
VGQPALSMEIPVVWDEIRDEPLWAFRLHEWDWAWTGLCGDASHESLYALIEDWIEHVPVGKGVGWQPYPASRRLVFWSAAKLSTGGTSSLVSSIAQHACFLMRNLERDLDNNHLIANGKALAWAGLSCPTLPQAQHWCEQGLRLLWDSLADQVRSDGGHVENSVSYHISVLLDCLETALLCRATGRTVPAEAWETLRNMGQFSLALERPDGSFPLLNDSTADEPVSLQTLKSILQKHTAVGESGESSVLCDNALFSQTGYAVLRSGPTHSLTYVVFDFGDLGPDHCPGHGHADALSFELWMRGRPIIVDPGTYQYAVGPWRDFFRGTLGHNTATIDNADQSVFVGAFRVSSLAHGYLVSAHFADFPSITAEHDGYAGLKEPVIHRRRISLPSADQFRIHDRFLGHGVHRIMISFHLAPGKVNILNSSSAEIEFDSGIRARLVANSAAQGALSIRTGWLSSQWYSKVPAPVLVYDAECRLPEMVCFALDSVT